MIEILPLVLKTFFAAWAILFVVGLLYAIFEEYPNVVGTIIGMIVSFMFVWFSVYGIVTLLRFVK